MLDWTVHPNEESSKSDKVVRLWQNERSYRPPVGLDVSPFYEDITLTLHDFNYCIWKHDVDVPIFDSAVVKSGQITCGSFSPSRPGVVIVGLNDGTLNIWDFLDQSHKPALTYIVGAKPLSYIKFHDYQPHSLVNISLQTRVKFNLLGGGGVTHQAVGDVDGTVHILELPYTLWKKIGDEEKTMNEFWKREVSRVKYFKKRFEIREDQARKHKEKLKELENADEKPTTTSKASVRRTTLTDGQSTTIILT